MRIDLALGPGAPGAGGGGLAARYRFAGIMVPAVLVAFFAAALGAGNAPLLGFAGFWLAPVLFDAYPGYDQAVFAPTVALFIAWTFINIHHYFIDNVTWRRENPETRRHLFGGGAR